MDNTGDDFNVAIVATARAEMAARGWSVDDLLRLLPDKLVSRRTLFRLVDTEAPPDRGAPLWRSSYIAAVAQAFGMTPYQFIAEAERRQARMRGVETPGDHGRVPKGDDPRTIIAWLIANPSQDEELNNRLSEADATPELRGSALVQIRETIRDVRRAELERALAALPPSPTQGGNRQSG